MYNRKGKIDCYITSTKSMLFSHPLKTVYMHYRYKLLRMVLAFINSHVNTDVCINKIPNDYYLYVLRLCFCILLEYTPER